MTGVQAGRWRLAVSPLEQAVREDQPDHHHKLKLLGMAQRVR
jgi:hypothetical protein